MDHLYQHFPRRLDIVDLSLYSARTARIKAYDQGVGWNSSQFRTVIIIKERSIIKDSCGLLRLPAGLCRRLERARGHTRSQCSGRCGRGKTVAGQHHVPRVPALSSCGSRHRCRELSAHLHQLTLLPLVLCRVIVQLQADKKRSALPAGVRPPIDSVIAAWERTQRQIRHTFQLAEQSSDGCLRQTQPPSVAR